MITVCIVEMKTSNTLPDSEYTLFTLVIFLHIWSRDTRHVLVSDCMCLNVKFSSIFEDVSVIRQSSPLMIICGSTREKEFTSLWCIRIHYEIQVFRIISKFLFITPRLGRYVLRLLSRFAFGQKSIYVKYIQFDLFHVRPTLYFSSCQILVSFSNPSRSYGIEEIDISSEMMVKTRRARELANFSRLKERFWEGDRSKRTWTWSSQIQ